MRFISLFFCQNLSKRGKQDQGGKSPEQKHTLPSGALAGNRHGALLQEDLSKLQTIR